MSATIAIITSGGDCSGMNAAVRAVTRTALGRGARVIGYQRGYQGVVDNDWQELTTRSVAGVIYRGGTFLHSSRCPEFRTEEGVARALANLRREHVDGLVVIGGDGSLRGALKLAEAGFPVVGIPASIDNDIPLTDMALGVDTALNNIVRHIDCIKDTASSHARAFVIEVMGRNCGYLASVAAVASGAEYALVPERSFDLDEVCAGLKRRYEEGRDNAIIVLAEGAGRADDVATSIKDRIGFEVRVSVLGHYQRGGTPTVFDRLLASRMGKGAVDELLSGRCGVMMALQNGTIVPEDLGAVLDAARKPADEVARMAEILGT